MSKAIPVRLRAEFVAYMEANDLDSLPDGAWFANLEAAALRFIRQHKLKWADENDAVHQYLELSTPEGGAS
jgi:hypothetical protein